MQYKYKKIIYLVLTMIVIYSATNFLISNLKEQKLADNIQVDEQVLLETRTEIYNTEDYLMFVESVNAGNTYQNCEVSLQSDLDFSEYDNLSPIGTVGEEPIIFLGVFNGNGYTISGVTMERPGEYVGLFLNLGGIVKNLQIRDSRFSGRVCGAIAADTTEAAVLNCYVDVEVCGDTAGAIVGKQDGNLFNCVATSDNIVGKYLNGKTEQCYQVGNIDFNGLDQNLAHISGYYDDTDFCRWGNEGLLKEKVDLLENLTAKLKIKGADLNIYAYYSRNKNSWCITFPATYGIEKVSLEARSCNGGYQAFIGNPEDEMMIFTWENRYYPVEFLFSWDLPSAYVTLPEKKGLEYVHKHKIEEIPGILTIIDTNGETSYTKVKGFYGHGNDSWNVEKKSYNLKLEEYTDLMGMGANEDYVFIAGYRNGSLMSYVATTELAKEVGFAYAPEFRLLNLYVAGEYLGVYFLTEKVEIDKNRIELESVYERSKVVNTTRLDSFEYCSWKDEEGEAERYYYSIEKNPEDITGAYLLEADVMDYADDDSRFLSDRRLKFTLKRAKYSSKEQVDYIADFWQEFENALYAEDGYNEQGKHYSEYIDMESFAMQWLCYELAEDISLSSSIYFYKESDITGDGLLHACYPWDVEHSYVERRLSEDLWLINNTSLKRYWQQIYKHEDFQKEVWRVWDEKYIPAIQKMIYNEPMEYDSGLRNLRWYQDKLVGVHYMENSRWDNIYLWNRCGEIRDFIEFRLNALSKQLIKSN